MTKEKKKLIFSHIFQYTSAQYFSQFFGFFTAILLRRFLGPVYIGIWNLLRVIIDYAGWSNLGSTYAVTYKTPILRGEGQDQKAQLLCNVVFNFAITATLLCSLGVIAYALIFSKTLSKEIFVGLLSVSVILITQRIYTYYIILLRANKNFTVLSKSIIFDAIVNLSLIILVVSKFKLYGFYFVIILMPILNTLFIRHYVKYELVFKLNFKGIFEQIRYGFPLFITAILQQILNSIDRIMIAGMLGIEQLGFYSIALMAKSYGTGLSKNFCIVIQPHFLADFGASGGKAKSSAQIVTYSQITAYFMSWLLSIIFITAPVFITYILPKFTPGIIAMRIFLLTTFFLSIVHYPNNMIVALKKQAKLIPITSFVVIINIVLNFVFIKRGYGINGVAVATAISAFISFFAISFYGLIHSENIFSIIKFFIKVLFPLVCCAVIVSLLDAFSLSRYAILDTIIKVLLFIIASLPLIFYINKKTGVVKMIIAMTLEKLKKKRK